MIELPEATVLAKQISEAIGGKRIKEVVAARTPHKLVWYLGDPRKYGNLLTGKTISGAASYGGQLEITAGNTRVSLSDGVNVRYYHKGEKLPDKHQLLLELDDRSFLLGWVQIYGGISAFREGENDNKYYLIARKKPSPLSGDFDQAYYESLFDRGTPRLSLKAFLATEQRIPGLGNGVLQDILFHAKMHPRTKVSALSRANRKTLLESIRNTLSEMTVKGGRDTENDLFGKRGGYATKLSKNTVGQPCPICGTPIRKEAYLGGSIYYCAGCQRV